MNQETEKVGDVKQRPRKAPIEIYRIGAFKNIKVGSNSNQTVTELNTSNGKVDNLTKSSKISLAVQKDSNLATGIGTCIVGKDNSKIKQPEHSKISNSSSRSKSEDKDLKKSQESKSLPSKKNINVRPNHNLKVVAELLDKPKPVAQKFENNKKGNVASRTFKEVNDPPKNRDLTNYNRRSAEVSESLYSLSKEDYSNKKKFKCKSPKQKDYDSDIFHGTRTFNNTSRSQVKNIHLPYKSFVEPNSEKENEKYVANKHLQETSKKLHGLKSHHLEKESNRPNVQVETLHNIDKSATLHVESNKRKSISKTFPNKQISTKNFNDCRTSLGSVVATSNSDCTNGQPAKPIKLLELNTKDSNNERKAPVKTKLRDEKITEANASQNYQSIKSPKGPKISLNINNDSQDRLEVYSQKRVNSTRKKKNDFTDEKNEFKNINNELDRPSKINVESENCFTGPTKEFEASKLLECMKLDVSTDETGSHDSDLDEDVTLDNHMTYIDFQDNSFDKTSNPNSISTAYKSQLNSVKCNNSKNICWGDEKWSPAQRQRKYPGKSRKREKESFAPESPGRRGIIQINNSNTNSQHDSSPNGANIHPVGQKMLFNPNNPSKPVAVTPSARDMPPTWDNCNVTDDKIGEENTNSEYDIIDTSFENGSKIDPSIFYGIQKGELDINYYVSSNQIPQEFRRIMDIRKHLQNCYSQLLITDIRLCQEKNIENALWKSLYYVIIEKLREYITREPSLKDRSLSTLLMLVEDGLEYLQKLVKDLQKAYRFSLDGNFEEDLMTVSGTKNRVRLALFSCQKILLCMGDLARYKEQYNQTPNFNSAKTWYEKALQVHPRNGRPFNQLAIIAVSQKRPLDVVYYYIRSLTAANPFTSARDSLISMFEDIRRKYESMEKIPSNPKCKNVSIQPEELSQRDNSGSLRQEIWIRPDSGATHKRTLTQSDHEEERNARIIELLQLPPDQLMKHFLTGFLHCHGMLFSRVGLDHFMDVLVTTLNLFQVLLKLSPPRLSPTHLLQIMAVNMFAVDNTQLRDTRIESGYRSAAQDLALLLSQEMFSRLAETMVSLFPQNFNYPPVSGNTAPKLKSKGPPYHDKNSSDKNGSFSEISERVWDGQGLFMPQLAHFAPAAKVWCDWLLYQSSIWNPPPVMHDLKLGLDTWGVIGELATIVKGIGPPDLAITEEGPGPNLVAVTLPEDSFLRGYTPLLAAHRSSYFVPKGTALERARDWVRICKFQLCMSQFLCGVEPPVLRLQKTDQGEILVPIVAETPPDSPSARPNRDSISSSDVDVDDSISDFDSSDEDDLDKSIVMEDDTPLASTVRLLAIRKKMLEKKQRQQRKMQALLEGSITLEIEVRPRYLVPDTNCFIEHLDVIKALINFKNNAYTMMVPLVVLSELDGLSRDAAVEKYGDAHHAVNVREGAAAALHYIRSTKHSQLKCVTSQGSILPSTMFTSEIDSQQDVTNDDKILSCCLQYCGDTHQRRVIKKGVRRLYREVVLLTEDRNLRVKAYARDVPVRDLLDFAHWAGIK